MAEETRADATDPNAAKPDETATDAPTTDAAASDDASSAEAGATSASEGAVDSGADVSARVAELEAEVADVKDRLLRAAADMQNMRKRADKERRDAETFASAKFARDILTVFDNLDQAVGYATDDLREASPGFVNGVELTQRELLNVFAKHKIELMRPEPGDRFDPNVHEAMARIPMADVEPGAVASVMQAGFVQAGRLLRPAMVAVAMAPPATAAPAPAPEAADAPSETAEPTAEPGSAEPETAQPKTDGS